jgi:hypothetical protein
MIRLTAQHITLDASADGEPSRQITGLAVPWNVKATLSGGESVVFLEGSLPEDGPMPKLLEYHDDTQNYRPRHRTSVNCRRHDVRRQAERDESCR